ncbi:MAG: HAMP domain-containing sensor histidine kinase [Bdellovibrionota bacterium]
MFKSSVLIFDKRISRENTLGADTAYSFEDVKHAIQNHNYQSITLSQSALSSNQALEIVQVIKNKNTDTQIIFISDENQGFNQAQGVQQISNKFSVFKIISSFDEKFLFRTIQESLEEYNLKAQNNELLKILTEQNEKLQVIKKDLEDRIVIRQQGLLESKEKLLQTSKYYGSILVALVAIQKSESISEMERTLLKSLNEPLNISWVRILFQSQTSVTNDAKKTLKNYAVFEHDLVLEKRNLGKIIFARESDSKSSAKFNKEEIQFLRQMSDAISLAMDRLIQREQSDFLRKQWQSTFDAITEPVALIRSNFEIVQHNAAYKKQFPTELHKAEHQHELGEKFSLRTSTDRVNPANNQEKLFEVDSQKMKSDLGENIYINIYRDLTKQKKTERQILESSKIAELGLIGGSIAHELNNPLAGLITFIQMLKQDVVTDNNKPLFDDLEEMEKSALRCKEIIQNLLSFSRKSNTKKESLHLQDLINKAIRIIQIKTKPLGIEIKFSSKVKTDIIEGHENPLTQSLVNIMQNSLDSISERQKIEKTFNPLIEVELSNDSSSFFLDILDNGIGLGKNEQLKVFTPFFTTKNPEQHRGLGLTTSYQILQEHAGDIELTQVFEKKTRARITFPKN